MPGYRPFTDTDTDPGRIPGAVERLDRLLAIVLDEPDGPDPRERPRPA